MTPSPSARRWIAPAAIVGGWTVVGLVSSSLLWSTWQAERLTVGLDTALLITMPYWLFWALVTPLITWLGRKAPLDRGHGGTGARGHGGRWAASLMVHLTACVVIGLVHASVYMWANLHWFPFPSAERVPSFAGMLRGYVRSRWQFELILYWAILGASLAVTYYRQGEERLRRASDLEAQLAQSQLQALRMQLHPHFLFNTLQAISVLVVDDPRAAQRMLTLLGDLLRAVLDGDDRQEIPLYDELDFLRRYLEIEQVRFPDRLAVHFDVDDAAEGALVPSFILQPLVENAIRYAIAPSAGPGRVAIAARVDGARLLLSVRDSGPGFPEPVEEGVGLSTTRARLEKLYGPAHRLDLTRAPDGGAVAELELPLRHEAADRAG